MEVVDEASRPWIGEQALGLRVQGGRLEQRAAVGEIEQLVTIGKDLSFRLTDFVSEYAFPKYSFKGDDFQLKYIKPRQDMLLKHEGFADHIKPNQ